MLYPNELISEVTLFMTTIRAGNDDRTHGLFHGKETHYHYAIPAISHYREKDSKKIIRVFLIIERLQVFCPTIRRHALLRRDGNRTHNDDDETLI